MNIRIIQRIISGLSRFVCGISVYTRNIDLSKVGPAIYFANHSSHFDFIAIWSSIPREIRSQVRPVAALNYWGKPGLRSFLSREIFNAILIERNQVSLSEHPLAGVKEALAKGDSVIIFPEGTRSLDGSIHDFKSGIYHLSKDFPHIPLVPVYLDNLNRILPKGEFLVLPLLSRVTFGSPLYYSQDEDKKSFLAKTKSALEALTWTSTN